MNTHARFLFSSSPKPDPLLIIMSLTMSPPSVTQSSQRAGTQLPPLSSILNSPKDHSEPVSPVQDARQPQLKPLDMRTPIRLPSFDSLQFDKVRPAFHHSHSFSGLTSVSKISATPRGSFTLPTPVSTKPSLTSTHHSSSTTSLPQLTSSTLHTPVSTIGQPVAGQQESPLVEKRSFAFISHSPSTFPSQEPSIDNAQLARRKRRRTSPGELAVLLAEFQLGQTPNRAKRIEIASKVNMTEKAVQIWFQNRRQTLRRQSNTQREVHHLELPPQMTPFTPVSSELKTDYQPTSPPQHQQQPQHGSSSPVHNTPSRPPRNSSSSKSPNTFTFRLTKHSTSPVKTETIMTPVAPGYRSRQKPVMRVNSQPATSETHSSPVHSKNVSPKSSPVKSPVKRTIEGESVKRQPLAEICLNKDIKPDTKDSSVVSLPKMKQLVE